MKVPETTPLMTGNPLDIPNGGACLLQLPPDTSSAPLARSRLANAMSQLRFPSTTIDDGMIGLGEVIANAIEHCPVQRRADPYTPPELWLWSRTQPQRELIVSVFDTCRDATPQIRVADLLDEHGKGLAMLAAVSQGWGHHPTRSRLSPRRTPGKRVWFALPLPDTWPDPRQTFPPARTAHWLHTLLDARSITGIIRNDRNGVSLLSIRADLSIWIYPDHFTVNADGSSTTRPLTDLHDLAEGVVARFEQDKTP
ncbi:MAG: putative anti-sigma regulatory factor, serine/threonine protein kinase [Actinomycetia bacterium]|nr:putative anti-sigma regulatory factor, serine/threonine protein kinase [Actinomycetes bacterium]